MMAKYEHESGLFDSVGNIVHPHEQYHYYKGLYYAGVNQLDSAEAQFRKLLHVGEHQLEAYNGLFAIFQQKGLPDSLFKYGQLYEAELAAHTQAAKTDAIIQADNLYDYSRHQQVADKKIIESRRLTYAVLLLLLIALVMTAFLVFFKHKKNEKQNEIVQIAKKYHDTIIELEKAVKESTGLKQKRAEDKKIQAGKDTQIEQLKEIVADLKQQLNKMPQKGQALELNCDEIARQFRDLARPHTSKETGEIISPRAAKNEEWDKMTEMVRLCHTSFYLFIMSEKKLTSRELRVCILSRLQFSISEIATLIDSSEENVTNIRRLIAKKLFGMSSSKGLSQKLTDL